MKRKVVSAAVLTVLLLAAALAVPAFASDTEPTQPAQPEPAVAAIQINGVAVDPETLAAAQNPEGVLVKTGALTSLSVTLADGYTAKSILVAGKTADDFSKVRKAAIGDSVSFDVYTADTTAEDGSVISGVKKTGFKFLLAAKELGAVGEGTYLNIASETLITAKADPADVLYYRVVKGKSSVFPDAGAFIKTKWTKIDSADGSVPLGKLLKNACVIEVGASASEPDKTDRGLTQIYVNARPEKPAKVTVAKYGVLVERDIHAVPAVQGVGDVYSASFSGLVQGMEYQLTNAPYWDKVGEKPDLFYVNVGQAATELKFRTAAIEPADKTVGSETLKAGTQGNPYTPGSPEVKVKLSAMQKEPVPKIDYKKGILKASDKWEISWDGILWKPAEKTYKLAFPAGDGDGTLPEDTLDAWAKGYYFRTKADSNKKPPSDAVFAALNPPHYEFNPDHNELAHTATGNTYPIFAVAVKGDTKTLVPAQGTLLEHNAGDKWKKGLPKGDITAPLEVRIPGGATYLPSESVWIKFNSALGALNWGYSATDGNFAENEVSDLLADEAKWSENADISDPDVYIQDSGELVFEAYFYEGYPLLGVSLDGVKLESEDYTAEEGTITISAEAMAEVPVGTSIAVFTFSDGIYKSVVHVTTQNQYDVDMAIGLIVNARYASGGYNGTIELQPEDPPASLADKYNAVTEWLNGLTHTGGGKIPPMSELGVDFKIAAIDYNKYRITASKGSGDAAATSAVSMSFLFTT